MTRATAETTAERKTVLLVDDERDIVDTLREAFEDEGYSVEVAGNGREALDHLSNGVRPDVIILDILMPVMDGNRFYESLRALPAFAEVPVIVSTSDPSRAPSGVLIMRKPLRLDRLIAAVDQCCKG